MINSKDLMIDNLVWKNYGGYKLISGIKSSGQLELKSLGMNVNGLFDEGVVYPANLSEEVLGWFGFKRDTQL